MIYVFLAEGFEEVEALTPVDCLRRAGKTVQTVGVGGKVITGSHGIPVTADITAAEIALDDNLEMIVLPGGMPGTLNLEKSDAVQAAIRFVCEQEKWLCAICAAPSVLGHLGLLKGRQAICYPGFEPELTGAEIATTPAVQDGNIITGKGPGAAMDFAKLLVEAVTDADTAEKVFRGMVYCQ